jgi:hypothetical protein
MENEVVIHVRAEDDTAAGFAKARASAKKLGEQIERDLKQSGTKGGRGLADGIGQGFESGHGSILGSASDLGSGVSGILGDAGQNAGAGLGRGVLDGFDDAAPDVLSGATTLGQDVADELAEAGHRGGEGFSRGLSDGMRRSGGGGDDDGGLIPDVARRGLAAGKKAGTGFVEGLGSILLSVGDNPKVVGGLALAGATFAPLIGGLLGAAVVGGAAGLGIVGGFVAASVDPRVRGAAEALKDTVSDDLKDAVKPFVPEAVAAIGTVRSAWRGILPDIESIFANSGRVMDPLIGGILDGVTSIIDGIEKAVASSGPVVESFGDMFAEVGQALGDMFTSASGSSEAWAAALDFLTSIITGAIDALTFLTQQSAIFIEAVRPIGEAIHDAGAAIGDWTDEIFGNNDAVSASELAQGQWRDGVTETTDSVYAQVEALRALEQQMRKQTDPLFEVLDLQTKVKLAQEKHTKAVEEFGPESGKARKALLDMGKASFQLTSALTTAASEGFDGRLTPAMRTALRNAGATAGQIDRLEKELIAAARAAQRWEGTFTQTYIVKRRVMATDDYKTSSGIGGQAHGGITGAANGSMSSGLTMVGESGPELVRLPAGTQVHSNPDTRRIAANGFGPQHGAPPPIAGKFVVDPSGSSKLMRVLLEALRLEISSQGGNVQTVLGVSRVG